MSDKTPLCKKCKAELYPDSKICPMCGAKVSSTSALFKIVVVILGLIIVSGTIKYRQMQKQIRRLLPQPIIVDSKLTKEKEDATRTAQSYADNLHMSREGLFRQLTSEYGEGIDEDDAEYALNHITVDYKANALYMAKEMAERAYMSESGIRKQLTYEYGLLFTAEEATYALENLDVDYRENAVLTAERYSNEEHRSKEYIAYRMSGYENGDLFPEEYTEYALSKLDIDDFENALLRAEYYSEKSFLSKKGIYDTLCSEYSDRYTVEQAQYAIDNLEADYKENALNKAIYYRDTIGYSNEKIKSILLSEYGDCFTEEEVEYAMKNLK